MFAGYLLGRAVAQKKPTEYIVIVSSDPVEFGKTVNQMLNEGWRCQGGVSGWVETCLQRGSYGDIHKIYITHMAQAMVR